MTVTVRKESKVFYLTTYLLCSVVSYAGMCGDLDERCRHRWIHSCGNEDAWDHQGFAALIAIAGPLSVIASFFATGFYHNGLRFTVRTQKEAP